MPEPVSAAARLLQWWHRLEQQPGGKWLFTRILGAGIPYTGTIRPRVLTVEPGHARVELHDRRRVRNHLNSIHALAIANLGELTTGLAVTAALPANVRSILTQLQVDFLAKARGTLTSVCSCDVPAVSEPVEFRATSYVQDGRGDVVATITATWRLAPIPAPTL